MDPRLPGRFWAKTRIEDCGFDTPCVVWTGSRLPKGYGRLSWQGKSAYAHRVAYEVLVRPIPEGFTIDHLCRNTSCVNVEHLEPVTSRVNTLRGETLAAANAAKTHCDNGHEFTPENTRTKAGRRECIACMPAWRQTENARRCASRAARPPKPPRTHCRNGHLLDEANIYTDKHGRHCRKCMRARAKRKLDKPREG